MDSVVVVESGWRRAWLCVGNPVAQCDVSEDGLNDRGVFDGGDDAQRATTVRAGLDIDVEHPLESLHPGEWRQGVVRVTPRRWLVAKDDQLAMLELWSEDAVIASQVNAWPRYQRSQPCDERKGVHDDVGGAVAERVFELVHDLRVLIDREALIGHGRSGDIAA